MLLRDIVHVADAGLVRLRTTVGALIAGRSWESEHSVVEVQGWVRLCLRERGKIVPGSFREGHNIWTNTGREFNAMLQSLASPGTKFRQDSIAYLGVGTGSQIEDASVLKLVNPVAYTGAVFLAPLDTPPTFPLTPTRTTVRYRRTFVENEITPGTERVDISELGLFTDGSPSAVPAFKPGTRDLSLANAGLQAPCAYKSFEPVGKTNALQLEVAWEIRF